MAHAVAFDRSVLSMEATEASQAGAPVEPGKAEHLTSHGLKGRLLRGVTAEVTGYGVSQVLRLASNLILTRVLYPEAFGLMSMLGLVLYGLIMLTDVGFAPMVIRSPHGDEPLFLDTVWTLKAVRGFLVWVGALLLAWPASILFREPQLVWMIPIGSASVFISSLHSMRVTTLRRHLRVVPVVLLDLGQQAVTILVSVGLALAGMKVWSLVVATLVGASVYTVLSFFLPGTHRDRIRIDPSAKEEIVRFGRWVFASSAVTLGAGRGDQLVLGRLLGAASLGVYNIALSFAEVPEALVGRLIDGMLLPLYSRVHNDRPWDLPRVYYRSRLILDSLVHTSMGGLVALAPWLVHLMYDARYQGAAPLLEIVALRTSLTVLANPCESVLLSAGQSQYSFRRNLAVAITNFIAMPAGYYLAGATGLMAPAMGLVWGTVVARGAGFIALWPAVRQRGLFRLHRELLFLPALALGYGLGELLTPFLPWKLPWR